MLGCFGNLPKAENNVLIDIYFTCFMNIHESHTYSNIPLGLHFLWILLLGFNFWLVCSHPGDQIDVFYFFSRLLSAVLTQPLKTGGPVINFSLVILVFVTVTSGKTVTNARKNSNFTALSLLVTQIKTF